MSRHQDTQQLSTRQNDTPRTDIRRTDTQRTESGQAAIVVVAVAAALLVVMLGALATMGRTATRRVQAQNAADAAALAALDGGHARAASLATQNGAVLIALSAGPGPFEVSVTVRIGDVTATARASNAP